MTAEELFQDGIRRLVEQAIPEGNRELRRLWDQSSQTFSLSKDESEFRLEVAFGTVVMNRRALLTTWLVAHEARAAWTAFGTQIWIADRLNLLRFGCVRRRFKVLLHCPPDQRVVEQRLRRVADELRRMEQVIGGGAYQLPQDFVQFDRRPADPSDAAVYDLGAMAIAAIILHELNHVRAGQQGRTETDPRAEELRSDAFARDMFLGGAADYARKWGVDGARVGTKRAIALAIAMFLICRLTPRSVSAQSSTHPPLRERMRALTRLALPLDSKFWIVLASLLVVELISRGRLPDQVQATTALALCSELGDLLPG